MATSPSSEKPPARIFINDVTLRDGEQAPGNSMSIQDKLFVARQLLKLGVNGIEAGFPAASPGDFDAVQAIAQENGNQTIQGYDEKPVHPRISGLARLDEKDIAETLRAVTPAPHRGIHTFISTSPDQMIKFATKVTKSGGDPGNINDFIAKVVIPGIERNFQIIRQTDPETIIQFSLEDWTRTPDAVSDDVIAAAVANGAKIINLPDTVGVGIPRIVGRRVQHVRELLDRLGFPHVVISWHGHNDTGQGVANAMEALYGGARQFEPTILGIGERTGNFAFEGFLGALDANLHQHEEIIGAKIEDTIVRIFVTETAKKVALILGRDIGTEHPLVGENAFAHESGIHQAGQIAGRLTGTRLYEALDPARYGAVSKLILGKHSGWAGLKDFIQRHNLPQRDSDRSQFTQALSAAGDTRRKGLSDQEVLELVYYPVVIALTEGAFIQGAEKQLPTDKCLTIALRTREGTQVVGVASAPDEGEIDAIVHAMNQIIPGVNVPKNGFHVRSVGEGSEAEAEASFTIHNNGRSVRGSARDPDTQKAITKALLSAFNSLVAIEHYKQRIDDSNKSLNTGLFMESLKPLGFTMAQDATASANLRLLGRMDFHRPADDNCPAIHVTVSLPQNLIHSEYSNSPKGHLHVGVYKDGSGPSAAYETAVNHSDIPEYLAEVLEKIRAEHV